MDALRRAEADKRRAQQESDVEDSAIRLDKPSPDTGLEPSPELSLSPLEEDLPSDNKREHHEIPTTRAAPPSGVDPLADLDDDFGAFESTNGDPQAAPSDDLRRGPLGTMEAQIVVDPQTIFDAGERRRPGRGFAILGGLTALFALGLSTVGIYYLQQQPQVRTIPSPLVQQKLQKPPPPVPAKPAPTDIDAPSSGGVTITPEVATPTPALAPEHTPPIAAAPALLPAPPRTKPQASSDAASETNPNLPPFEVTGGEIHLVRNKVGARASNRMLTDAYAAYRGGDYRNARIHYEKVLAQHPRQVDALLGLAALAMRDERIADAYRLYEKVRAIEPDNVTAAAALFSIEGGDGRELNAAKIKVLLDQGHNAAFLHFALGNYFARHGHWGDAQLAYFNALKRDAEHPDYAFNLAVSLERIGQNASAISYYEKALAWRAHRAARFDAALASARIATLRNSNP